MLYSAVADDVWHFHTGQRQVANRNRRRRPQPPDRTDGGFSIEQREGHGAPKRKAAPDGTALWRGQ